MIHDTTGVQMFRSLRSSTLVFGACFAIGCSQASPTGPSSVIGGSVGTSPASMSPNENGASMALPAQLGLGAVAEVVTSNVIVPFDVVLQGATEEIAVVGRLHVETTLRMSAAGTLLTVHSNLLDTRGLGLSSGKASVISGVQFLSTVVDDDDLTGGIFAAMLAYQRMLNSEHREDRQALRLDYRVRIDSANEVTVSIEQPPPCYECTL